jgi:signal transduction histidine kinase
LELCAFRIIQEALRNVVKHSGAYRAAVILGQSGQLLSIVVSDSGCGFDSLSDEIRSGLGFIGMRERVQAVGGKLSIFSEPNRGTRIEAFIPLGGADGNDSLNLRTSSPPITARSVMEPPLTVSDTTLEEI